jgi:tripartite-type tricarboxylate transporter receptor subunit TctC
MVVTPVATARPPYDSMRDFAPISILVVAALTFAVHPAQPFHSLNDVIDFARKNPGKLSYGSAGVGTINHLAGELFKSLTATDIVHVPYRGSGPALTDLIGGQIPTTMANITGQVLELHRSGKLRMLAVTAPARLAAAPDIPTCLEAGVPGMVAQNFVGLFAPRGTPAAIIDQVAQATRTAMEEHDFRELLSAASLDAHVDSSPAKARQFLGEELARWIPVIRAIGLKLD